jgi:hypothetical protein
MLLQPSSLLLGGGAATVGPTNDDGERSAIASSSHYYIYTLSHLFIAHINIQIATLGPTLMSATLDLKCPSTNSVDVEWKRERGLGLGSRGIGPFTPPIFSPASFHRLCLSTNGRLPPYWPVSCRIRTFQLPTNGRNSSRAHA